MPRSYSDYFAPFGVLAQTSKTNGSGALINVQGNIFIGSRFLDTLLRNNKLYQQLGFQLLEEIQRVGGNVAKPPTTISLGTQSDGQRISSFRLFSIVLIPADVKIVALPYGDRYTTRIPASFTLTDQQVADVLYAFTFTFDTGTEIGRAACRERVSLLV